MAEWLAGALGGGGPGTLAAPEIFWATRRLLETLARRRPLLVVLEDLHWAEPTFLDLAETVAGQARQGCSCSAWPGRSCWSAARPGPTGWRRPSGSSSGRCPTATPASCWLALAGTPPEARERLLEVADGNPLFLEQLAASLGEQHRGEDEHELPATIQALLAARLELLGPGERAVLWRAAVVGRDFTRDAVAELLPPEAAARSAATRGSWPPRGW